MRAGSGQMLAETLGEAEQGESGRQPPRIGDHRAIADVQASRRKIVKDLADAKYGNKDCNSYSDMYEILARDDIDSVLIATGDHWHALASIIAAKAGKDVYSEKPCSITIGDCQALADTINR